MQYLDPYRKEDFEVLFAKHNVTVIHSNCRYEIPMYFQEVLESLTRDEAMLEMVDGKMYLLENFEVPNKRDNTACVRINDAIFVKTPEGFTLDSYLN